MPRKSPVADFSPLSAAKVLVKKTEALAKHAKVSQEMEQIAANMRAHIGKKGKTVSVIMKTESGVSTSITMSFDKEGKNIDDPVSHMDAVLEAASDYARKVSVLFYERTIEGGKDL